MITKRTLVLTLLALGTFSTATRPRTANADPGCTVQSLSGPYTYAITGEYFDPRGNLYHFSAAGRIVADGAGSIDGKDTTSDGGFITRGRQYTASYRVNSDCTGTMVFQPGANMDMVITNNGKNINFIQTDQSTNIAGTAQQQFPADPVKP